MKQGLKKATLLLWGVALLGALVFLWKQPELRDPDSLVAWLRSYGDALVWPFVIVTMLRGLVMLPSTPIILAGTILYPDDLWWVFWVSMSGIMFSALVLYRFSSWLGILPRLEAKYPDQTAKWLIRIQSPYAWWLIAFWGFFPGVPTDLVCCLCGVVRMPLWRMASAIFTGEVILVAIYIWLGSELGALFG